MFDQSIDRLMVDGVALLQLLFAQAGSGAMRFCELQAELTSVGTKDNTRAT